MASPLNLSAASSDSRDFFDVPSFDLEDDSSSDFQNGNRASVKKWKQEEDDLLLSAIQKFGEHNWKLVATIVGTRDPGKFPSHFFFFFGILLGKLFFS